MQIGKRPLAPRYLNWRDVCATPWADNKIIRKFEDPPSPTESELALQEQIKECCGSLRSDGAEPSVHSFGMHYPRPAEQSLEPEPSLQSFIQREKEHKSEVSSSSLIGRRIGKRLRVPMKQISLNRLIHQFQGRRARHQRARRAQRKKISWLEVHLKGSRAKITRLKAEKKHAEVQQHAWKKQLGRDQQRTQELNRELQMKDARLRQSVPKAELAEAKMCKDLADTQIEQTRQQLIKALEETRKLTTENGVLRAKIHGLNTEARQLKEQPAQAARCSQQVTFGQPNRERELGLLRARNEMMELEIRHLNEQLELSQIEFHVDPVMESELARTKRDLKNAEHRIRQLLDEPPKAGSKTRGRPDAQEANDGDEPKFFSIELTQAAINNFFTCCKAAGAHGDGGGAE